MKVEINRSSEDKKEIKYPALFEHRMQGFIVMFTAPRVGYLMVTGPQTGADWRQGDHRADWAEHHNTSVWKKFEGSLTISND